MDVKMSLIRIILLTQLAFTSFAVTADNIHYLEIMNATQTPLILTSPSLKALNQMSWVVNEKQSVPLASLHSIESGATITWIIQGHQSLPITYSNQENTIHCTLFTENKQPLKGTCYQFNVDHNKTLIKIVSH